MILSILMPLFVTSRVLSAIYRIATTILLLIYLFRHVAFGHKNSRIDRRLTRVTRYDRGDEAYA